MATTTTHFSAHGIRRIWQHLGLIALALMLILGSGLPAGAASATPDLGQGQWRLHVLTNQAVPGPGYMGTAGINGTNTDVVLTFPSDGQFSTPETSSPVPFEVAWTKAAIQWEDAYDDEWHRGKYYVRFIPGAIGDNVLVQIAQVGYPVNGVNPDTVRLFSGRLQTRTPLMYFGHGAGNDGLQNLSFTFTKE